MTDLATSVSADFVRPSECGARPSFPPRLHLCLFLTLALLALILRVGSVVRDGISPDEEITLFAVRGISSEGAPRLPSGVLYDRGLLFSYLAWGAGRVFGDNLVSYRLPSLLAGCAIVVLTAKLALRIGGSPLLAGLLACGATWLVAASTWARFYGLFVACFMVTMDMLLGRSDDARRDVWFLCGLAAVRFLHEMGVILVVLPLFFFLQSAPGTPARSRFRRLLLKAILTLVLIHLLLGVFRGDIAAAVVPVASLDGSYGAPRLLPSLYSSSSTVGLVLLGAGALAIGCLLRLCRAPWLLCWTAVVCAATMNLGLLGVAIIGLLLARPQQLRTIAATGAFACLASLILGVAFFIVQTGAAFSTNVIYSLVLAGFVFPFAALVYLLTHWPLVMTTALTGLIIGWRRTEVRAIGFLVMGSLVFLGAFISGSKPRYFMILYPLLFSLAALVPQLMRRIISRRRGVLIVARIGISLLLLGALLFEHERGSRDSALLEPGGPCGLSRLRSAPLRIWTAVLHKIPLRGLVICNDDLVCLLLGRRADYWWLGSNTEIEAYGIREEGIWRSVYTGIPMLTDKEVVSTLALKRDDAIWIVVVDTAKYGRVDPLRLVPSKGSWSLVKICEVEGMRLLSLRNPTHGVGDVFVREEIQCSFEEWNS
jgi:hypothetical protein